MISCKTCNKDNVIKAGISHGKQRYKCKDCAVHFITHHKRLSKDDRLRAVRLCLYGISMNSVAKMFVITTTSVARWVKWCKKHPNEKDLPHDNIDRIYARLWASASSKSFKRQLVLRFRLEQLKKFIQNYQNVKPQKISLRN